MNKNIILRLTSYVFISSKTVTAILIGINLLFGAIAFLAEDFGAGMLLETANITFKNPRNIDANLSEFAESNPFSFLFALLQNLTILALFYKIFGSFLKVVNSINSLKTFTKHNVSAFKNISLFAFAIFCIRLVEITPDKITFGIALIYLIVAAFAYILAEVFKEGNQLREENELTV